MSNPLLQTTAPFALRDVDEIVQEQFAVPPRFRANDDGVAESDAPRVFGDDAGVPGGLSQGAIFRQRDPIDDQDSNALDIPDPGQARISHELRTQWSAVGENEIFLRFRPFISDGQKLFEGFLIDHVVEGYAEQGGKSNWRARSSEGRQFRMTNDEGTKGRS